MVAYRVYQMDGAGRFSTAEWIEAEDDAAAMTIARASRRDHEFELWQGNRLVADTRREPRNAT